MKLICCTIAQNEEDWLPISWESVYKIVDEFILVDSGSKDSTLKIAKDFCYKHDKELKILTYKRQNSPGDDGNQRQVYIDYLKANHIGDWNLTLDADECYSGDLQGLKTFLDTQTEYDSFNVRTHHLIQDFGHEDSTLLKHFTLRRLFKINNTLYQPATEHGVLQGELNTTNLEKFVEMWHFAHARHALYWLSKYYNMKNKSEIHSPHQQEMWYYNHILGRFPRKRIDPTKLPATIKDKFFVAGNVENWKYPVYTSVWRKFTSSDMAFDEIEKFIEERKINPGMVLDIGAGDAYFGTRWRQLHFDYVGMDMCQARGISIKGKMEDIPFWDNQVQAVFSCHSFEHTIDPIKTLQEIHRVLICGGVLYLIVPPPIKIEMYGMDKQHNFVLDADQIKSLLMKNKFLVEHEALLIHHPNDKASWSTLIIAIAI